MRVPEEQATEKTQRAIVLVMILGSLAAFGPLSIDMYLPAFPTIAGELRASPSAVQLTLTATILGLGLGGLFIGPMSDRYGRRRPLFIGLTFYVFASIACALAPNVELLTLARFVQGFAGAAGVVLSRAIARDLHQGPQLARFIATLLLVNGLAPILAPSIGSLVLRDLNWHGIFYVLAAFGVALLGFAAMSLRETLPAVDRNDGGLRSNLATFKRLLLERSFVGYALTTGLGMAVMFAYISGSSYVLQDVFGLSSGEYGLAFGANALGFVVVAQVGARFVLRTGPGLLLTVGLAGVFAATALLLAAILLKMPVEVVLPVLFLCIAVLGLVPSNAAALALNDQGNNAGSASGLLNLLQFVFGGAVAPLVGLGGDDTALPMAVVMVTVAATALLIRLTVVHPTKMRVRREQRERAVQNVTVA